ncbi:MAG: nitroreductase [Desulfotomaculales bacterium]
MNVSEVLASRYSVRAFKPDPVARETLLEIVRAANRAPSWGNSQPWEVYVAGGETLNRIRKAFLERFEAGSPMQPDLPRPQEWPSALAQRMAESAARRLSAMGLSPDDEGVKRASMRRNYEFFGAPAVAYLCLERELTPGSIFAVGMFAMCFLLAAKDHGVDSIPAVNLVAYPDILRKELGIPDNLMILIGVALGYADPDHPANRYRSSRRPVQEVVRFKDL